MAGFNPFAPQVPQGTGAPQVQGVQAPNVPIQQKQPSLTQQLAPTVFSKAMDSKVAGTMGTAAVEGVTGALAPAAAALGPFGIPVLVGAGLLAANGGK
jgi:hypothetical protein